MHMFRGSRLEQALVGVFGGGGGGDARGGWGLGAVWQQISNPQTLLHFGVATLNLTLGVFEVQDRIYMVLLHLRFWQV